MKNNLKEIRNKKKLTQRDLCRLSGINFEQELGKIENGFVTPKIDKALKIANALNVRVDKIWEINK